MNETEQHWFDRGGIVMHRFLVLGYNLEQHVAALDMVCGDREYCDAEVRHAIEGTACEAFRRQFGAGDVTGTWTDYVLPPYIDESGDDCE